MRSEISFELFHLNLIEFNSFKLRPKRDISCISSKGTNGFIIDFISLLNIEWV